MNTRDITPDMARAELSKCQAAKQEFQSRKFDNSILGSLSKIPGYAIGSALSFPENIKNLITKIPGTLEKIRTHPIESVQDVVGSIAGGSQKTASAALEAGEYLTRKGGNLLGKGLGHPVDIPYWNAREFMGLEGDRPINLASMIQSKNPDPLLSQAYNLLGASSLGAKIPGI